MKIYQEIIIAADVNQIASLFWNIQAWQKIWVPLQTIKILYEDHNHQEIFMELDRDGKQESNRTIRFRNTTTKAIDFFSPVPPPMMSYHKGSWSFITKNQHTTIIAIRHYDLKRKSAESNVDFTSREQQFFQEFTQRLQYILTSFKNTIEKKDVNYV